MNYHQLQFWLLFAALMLPYWWLPHRAQNRLLLVGSYVFYGFWDYRFLFLILISTMIDFIGGLGVAGIRLPPARLFRLGLLIVVAAILLTANIDYSALLRGDLAAALPQELSDLAIPAAVLGLVIVYGPLQRALHALPAARRRKAFLVLSMVANLAILGFFKYCDFFIASFHDLLNAIGVADGDVPLLHIILPAGISFYTFQAMSYTIDIYRGELEPTDRLDDFALFVCFFPHLVAGPIMRAHTLLPQVLKPRQRIPGQFEEGLLLVLIGLFKKIAISDNMAPITNAVFYQLAHGDTAKLTGPQVLVAIYAFAVQIYCDFSGYSSIARGISKWLGFELTINFRQPYIATSPSDFWRRWHISLSTWLRDYLYVPLGGNRHGTLLTYRNLMITMLLGGLWHGASWTFVAWGLFHGVILCLFRVGNIPDLTPADGLGRWLVRVVLMFHLTCLGWLLFRAESFAVVGRAFAAFSHVHVTSAAIVPFLLILFYSALLFALEMFTRGEENLQRLMRAPIGLQAATYSYLALMIVVFHATRAHAFIYFQF